jgi:hypothetical protein
MHGELQPYQRLRGGLYDDQPNVRVSPGCKWGCLARRVLCVEREARLGGSCREYTGHEIQEPRRCLLRRWTGWRNQTPFGVLKQIVFRIANRLGFPGCSGHLFLADIPACQNELLSALNRIVGRQTCLCAPRFRKAYPRPSSSLLRLPPAKQKQELGEKCGLHIFGWSRPEWGGMRWA